MSVTDERLAELYYNIFKDTPFYRYIDGELEELTNLFAVGTDGSGGPVVGCDVQKVRRLLMDIYKTGSLSKS